MIGGDQFLDVNLRHHSLLAVDRPQLDGTPSHRQVLLGRLLGDFDQSGLGGGIHASIMKRELHNEKNFANTSQIFSHLLRERFFPAPLSQYFGTLGSTLSLHARMPPDMFRTRLNPA